MSISTKSGDGGCTLFRGERVSKSEPLLDLIASLDSLNVQFGSIRQSLHGLSTNEQSKRPMVNEFCQNVQWTLLTIGAALASSSHKASDVEFEELMDGELSYLDDVLANLEAELPKLTQFILPTGNAPCVECHKARCMTRDVERLVVKLSDNPAAEPIIKYFNRLSDVMFQMARYVNSFSDETWYAPEWMK